MKFRFASSLFLLVLSLLISGIAAHADTLYNNGVGNEFAAMWDISGNAVASNQFTCSFGTCNTQTLEFDATYPGGTFPTKVDWSITSDPFGGTTYASGTSQLPLFYACDPDGIVCLFDVNFVSTLAGGKYYLNLGGVDGSLEWDTPSNPLNGNNAYYKDANGVVTSNILGEGFKISGTSTPEPGSILLFGSGVLGLAGVVRRRFLS
jgi:hypothetical protein